MAGCLSFTFSKKIVANPPTCAHWHFPPQGVHPGGMARHCSSFPRCVQRAETLLALAFWGQKQTFLHCRHLLRGARCCFLGGQISFSASVGRPNPKTRRSPSARALAGGKLGPSTENIRSEVVGVQGSRDYIPMICSRFPCWMSGFIS